MLKKALIAGGGLVLVLGLLFGRSGWSYFTTTMGKVQQTVKDSVPVSFEIERARKMIKDLDPEIRRNMHLIAKEEVEVERLQQQGKKTAADLAKDRDEILRLKGDLDSGNGSFVYVGRTYSAKQVQADLANRFERFKTTEATTDKLEKIVRARENGLVAAREKLESMLAAKRQLEVDVENLEARLKMVEVAQTTSDFNFDDSQLSRTKDLIRDIQTRIDVAEKLVNADTKFHDEIPLEEPVTTDNISQEIADYFGEHRAEIESYVNANR
jgi:septal ring factor EnvC (AmiA/AmiB activator)